MQFAWAWSQLQKLEKESVAVACSMRFWVAMVSHGSAAPL